MQTKDSQLPNTVLFTVTVISAVTVFCYAGKVLLLIKEIKLKTVLVIDDSAFMRMYIKNILEKNGIQVIGEAENGMVGVNLYRKLQPDLVTMDLTMPVMDGIQALKNILELNPNASVVMVSSMGQETFVKEAIISGAKSFIVKPFAPEALVKVLDGVF